MAGIPPTPGQHCATALDAVAALGLFVASLPAGNFAHHGHFKGQTGRGGYA